MQGGEDAYYTDDRLCALITEIKRRYPDCAVTLSLGERSHESYKRLFDAGADRYLLRHETADDTHYSKLHPENMSGEVRKECLFQPQKDRLPDGKRIYGRLSLSDGGKYRSGLAVSSGAQA